MASLRFTDVYCTTERPEGIFRKDRGGTAFVFKMK